jgi:hypothetical protein
MKKTSRHERLRDRRQPTKQSLALRLAEKNIGRAIRRRVWHLRPK